MKMQRGVATLAAAIVCLPALELPISSTPARDLTEIREFETAYFKTVNDGDVAAQLELVSRDAGVYSILDGEIWHGWAAVKAQAEAYVPISKVVDAAVDELEIVPLGPDAAIVVIKTHGVKADPSDTSFPDMAGVLTHVLTRTPAGWRMLHEHYSSTRTLELVEWEATMLRRQSQKASGNPPGGTQ